MYPKGYFSFGRNIGIKDSTLDFTVIYSDTLCDGAAVFTKNNFPGAPVIVGREHIRGGKLQAIVVNSKNSNVATGESGIEAARETCRRLAKNLNILPEHVLPSSTGIIGVPLPKEKIFAACDDAKRFLKEGNLEEAATAIMTTDKKKKISYRVISTDVGDGVIYGMAKGAGMIEPNMATMLSYILSDVKPDSGNLYWMLKEAVDNSFNRLSIDSDTSTSDTVVLMCNEKAGFVPKEKFQNILNSICIDLTKQIALDGEGATKLIELSVLNGKDEFQVRKIGKSIINSPLIKTAIYGGDPNWGRFIMAIGKVFDEPISYDTLSIKIGGIEMKGADKPQLTLLSSYLKSNKEILVDVNLNTGDVSGKFWGCDLSEEYVKENAYYST